MPFTLIVTDTGKAKLAAHIANSTTMTFAECAVGSDGTAPTVSQTELNNEQARVSINRVDLNDTDPERIDIEAIIPTDVGDFWIREVGIYDDEGDLIVVGQYPDTYKPLVEEGSERTCVIRIALKLSHTEAITLTTDLTAVIATRDLLDSHVNRRDNPHEVTAAQIIPGGTVNQVLSKASNDDGDYEWQDITAAAVIVDAQVETQELAALQTTVELVDTTTTGLAVYVGGARLVPGVDYTITDSTHIELSRDYPEGTSIMLVNNEPYGEVEATEESLGLVQFATVEQVFAFDGTDLRAPSAGQLFLPFAKHRQRGLYKSNPHKRLWVLFGGPDIEVGDEAWTYRSKDDGTAGKWSHLSSGLGVNLTALSEGDGNYRIYLYEEALTAQHVDSIDPLIEEDGWMLGGFSVSDGSIVEASLWDLNFRPASRDPEGMAHVGGFWADIWLTNTAALSPPAPGQTIAKSGGSFPPGFTAWTWYDASDAAGSVGKRLPTYAEFTQLAKGTTENSEVGVAPATTGYTAGRKSSVGCEQVSGCLHQWGGIAPHIEPGSSNLSTGGKGVIVAASAGFEAFGGTADIAAPGLGGSRTVYFMLRTASGIASRFVADHLVLY